MAQQLLLPSLLPTRITKTAVAPSMSVVVSNKHSQSGCGVGVTHNRYYRGRGSSYSCGVGNRNDYICDFNRNNNSSSPGVGKHGKYSCGDVNYNNYIHDVFYRNNYSHGCGKRDAYSCGGSSNTNESDNTNDSDGDGGGNSSNDGQGNKENHNDSGNSYSDLRERLEKMKQTLKELKELNEIERRFFKIPPFLENEDETPENQDEPPVNHCANQKTQQEKLDELEQELSKIVGLEELKSQLRKWAKGMLIDDKRRAMGLKLGPKKLPHMVFQGNPGTGKTTVARILSKLLYSVGILSKDKLTEVQRSDLVGAYIGQTALKTKRKIEEAMGGVLFVDEAYRLVEKDSSRDFGPEALEEIMSVMEDGNIVVIFAGYSEQMKRVFSTNEGFTRRVTNFFQFDDFSCNDLAEMLMIKMAKQTEKSRLYGFKLHDSCTLEAVSTLIEKNSSKKLRSKLNGGLVDHMLNNARENLDSRLDFDAKDDELVTITLQDLEVGLKGLIDPIDDSTSRESVPFWEHLFASPPHLELENEK